MSLLEQILARTIRDGDCMIWQGPKTYKGYGTIRMDGKKIRVHRIVCKETYGPPPDEKPLALHSCDTPPCVNPAHLRWGSNRENIADMDARGRGRRPIIRGEQHVRSKLTEADVVAIRAMRAQGVRTKTIALQFGVAARTIAAIAQRKKWKHVA